MDFILDEATGCRLVQNGELTQFMKYCPTCQQWKPLEDFYNDPKSKDGKTRECGDCLRERSRKSRSKKEAEVLRDTQLLAEAKAANAKKDSEIKKLKEQLKVEKHKCRVIEDENKALRSKNRAIRAEKRNFEKLTKSEIRQVLKQTKVTIPLLIEALKEKDFK